MEHVGRHLRSVSFTIKFTASSKMRFVLVCLVLGAKVMVHGMEDSSNNGKETAPWSQKETGPWSSSPGRSEWTEIVARPKTDMNRMRREIEELERKKEQGILEEDGDEDEDEENVMVEVFLPKATASTRPTSRPDPPHSPGLDSNPALLSLQKDNTDFDYDSSSTV